jgi:hypothetical protein
MFTACDYAEWKNAGFKDFEDFSECVEYVNQSEYGDDQLEGEWYYADDETHVIYWGSFGNYNSPGASHFTYAEQFTVEEYQKAVKRWESMPEYAE